MWMTPEPKGERPDKPLCLNTCQSEIQFHGERGSGLDLLTHGKPVKAGM